MWQQSWQTWKVQVSYNKGGGTGLAPEPPFPMGYIQNSWVALYCRCPSVSWRCHLDSWVSSWVDTLNSLVTSPCRCLSAWSPVLGIVIILLLAEGVLLQTPKFPGLLSIITWMDTWLSWNFPRLLEEVDLLCTWFCNIMYYLHYHVLKYL